MAMADLRKNDMMAHLADSLGDDPDACNVYKDLEFPEGVYARINEYYQQKTGARA